ncbi:MAG: beta-ketoacyl synthase N-terminal-like domain-containing protein, partial [Patescibacteria group bacterium]
MKKTPYYNNDICIVGFGCVLPDANNPSEFWRNILAGRCSIRKVPEERWSSRLYFSRDKDESDKTYSNFAAFVDNGQIQILGKNLGLDFSKNNRLQIMALEAARQALGSLTATLEKARKNTSVFLGCMELDEAFTLEKFYRHNKDSLKKFIAKNNLKNQRQILAEIKEYFCRHEPDDKA